AQRVLVWNEGLDSARAARLARVRVDRDEEVGVLRVGDRRPLLERDEAVAVAREDDLDAGELGLERRAQAPRDVEHDVLLGESAGPDRARVPPAVPRVDDDAVERAARDLDLGRRRDR